MGWGGVGRVGGVGELLTRTCHAYACREHAVSMPCTRHAHAMHATLRG